MGKVTHSVSEAGMCVCIIFIYEMLMHGADAVCGAAHQLTNLPLARPNRLCAVKKGPPMWKEVPEPSDN